MSSNQSATDSNADLARKLRGAEIGYSETSSITEKQTVIYRPLSESPSSTTVGPDREDTFNLQEYSTMNAPNEIIAVRSFVYSSDVVHSRRMGTKSEAGKTEKAEDTRSETATDIDIIKRRGYEFHVYGPGMNTDEIIQKAMMLRLGSEKTPSDGVAVQEPIQEPKPAKQKWPPRLKRIDEIVKTEREMKQIWD